MCNFRDASPETKFSLSFSPFPPPFPFVVASAVSLLFGFTLPFLFPNKGHVPDVDPFAEPGAKPVPVAEGSSDCCRGGKSPDLPPLQAASTSAHSTQPFPRASISGVTPCLSGRSGTAPCASNSLMTPRWPLAAAKCRGVEPTIVQKVHQDNLLSIIPVMKIR